MTRFIGGALAAPTILSIAEICRSNDLMFLLEL